ncbi:uncharacterized protein LOC131947697 [Physella acuta]|uniref:uncharacterized protein LOC131947697 n=1 Tax=Physella acuta TaxID=109671 RepID=UPI0027DB4519|nr:uncharacterized protein LOC131947697 [Physella acuta]
MSYLYILLVCLPALTLGQDMSAAIANIFSNMDSNKDGNVQRSEMAAYFTAFDTNHDGQVSRHEYSVYVTDIYGHSPELNHILHSLFDELDVNSDHHLDGIDYDRNFVAADTDGNNLVSPAEFERFFLLLASNAGVGK